MTFIYLFREIKLLQELSHRNVIELVDVFGHKSNVSIVMNFMDTDLEIIIKVILISDIKKTLIKNDNIINKYMNNLFL